MTGPLPLGMIFNEPKPIVRSCDNFAKRGEIEFNAPLYFEIFPLMGKGSFNDLSLMLPRCSPKPRCGWGELLLLLCFLDLICSNGTLDWDAFNDEDLAERFLDCLGVFLCTWLNCYVNQLCPQKDSDCLQVAGRCDFAVEEVC